MDICRKGQYATLLNAIPLYAAHKALPPLDFHTLYFTIESPEQISEILRDYHARAMVPFEHTAGLYYRTVK